MLWHRKGGREINCTALLPQGLEAQQRHATEHTEHSEHGAAPPSPATTPLLRDGGASNQTPTTACICP